jgi:hypothetical protein
VPPMDMDTVSPPQPPAPRAPLAQIVVVSVLVGVLCSYWAGILAQSFVEPLLHGMRPQPPDSWVRGAMLTQSDLLAWLLGGVGGAGLVAHAIARGHCARKRVRQVAGVLCVLSALAALQLSVRRGVDLPAIPFTAFAGFVAVACALAWIAVGKARDLRLGEGVHKRLIGLAVGGALFAGLPTLAEGWARHVPKDYPPLRIELILGEHAAFSRGADPSRVVEVPSGSGNRVLLDRTQSMTVTEADLLLVRERQVAGKTHVELHFSFAKSGELLRLSSRNIGKLLVVIVNGEALMAPVVRGALTGGRMAIQPGSDSSGMSDLYHRLSGTESR